MAKIIVTASTTVTVGFKDTVKVDINGGGNVLVQGTGGAVKEIKIDLMGNDTFSDHVTVDLASFAQDGLKIDLKNYDPTDQVTLQGATITGLVAGTTDQLAFTYVGADGQTHTGIAKVKDKGQNDFTAGQKPLVICFAAGTAIRTPNGERAIERLRPGDLVDTLDHGPQPLRWVGMRRLGAVELGLNPALRPIRIARGALDTNSPARDLVVSPQHRMLVTGFSDLLFGTDQVLVAAKHLINGDSIREVLPETGVTYCHLLFDDHQILFANGAASESLHPGVEAMTALDGAARNEVLALFPDLAGVEPGPRQTARRVLKAFEARVLEAFTP